MWLAAGELQPDGNNKVLKSLKTSSGLPWSFTVVMFKPRLSTAAFIHDLLALVHLVTM